ncbi:MAG: hypothetical protein AVDCRST_MAG65-1245, partial [uncultured Solirubrobacteraceae bacterium]
DQRAHSRGPADHAGPCRGRQRRPPGAVGSRGRARLRRRGGRRHEDGRDRGLHQCRGARLRAGGGHARGRHGHRRGRPHHRRPRPRGRHPPAQQHAPHAGAGARAPADRRPVGCLRAARKQRRGDRGPHDLRLRSRQRSGRREPRARHRGPRRQVGSRGL